MNRIPTEKREQCITIMKQLMKRPCATVFLEPVNPEQDGFPNYLNVIKRPIDLSTILDRLLRDEYTSVVQWNRDMGLIWSNAEKFFGRDAYISVLAGELRRNFEHEYKSLRTYNMNKWCKITSELKDEIDSLLDSPPEGMKAYATISEKAPNDELEAFADEEIDSLIRATQKLTSAMDGKKLLHIARYCDASFQGADECGRIDIGSLSISALHALREYTQQRLSELSIPYPK